MNEHSKILIKTINDKIKFSPEFSFCNKLLPQNLLVLS